MVAAWLVIYSLRKKCSNLLADWPVDWIPCYSFIFSNETVKDYFGNILILFCFQTRKTKHFRYSILPLKTKDTTWRCVEFHMTTICQNAYSGITSRKQRWTTRSITAKHWTDTNTSRSSIGDLHYNEIVIINRLNNYLSNVNDNKSNFEWWQFRAQIPGYHKLIKRKSSSWSVIHM